MASYISMENTTRPWREIVYPRGKTISKVNCYPYKLKPTSCILKVITI